VDDPNIRFEADFDLWARVDAAKEPYLVIRFTAEARKSMPFLKISPTNSNSVTMIFCMASCDGELKLNEVQ
jgi:hypothetical protein